MVMFQGMKYDFKVITILIYIIILIYVVIRLDIDDNDER